MQFGTDAVAASRVTRAVKKSTSLPVMVKLSPNVTDIVEIARAVEDAGADAISLINTLSGMAIDVRSRRPKLGNIVGGLSGPAIKPVALWLVYRVAGAVRVPVVGGGGIMKAEDALEFIMAGATAVQVGTAGLVDPQSIEEIITALGRYLSAQGIRHISDLRGVARQGPSPALNP